MADEKRGFLKRHWTDTLFAVAALFVSAVSLWVGIRTEKANEELVAAAHGPYLLVESSNANPDAQNSSIWTSTIPAWSRRRSKTSKCSERKAVPLGEPTGRGMLRLQTGHDAVTSKRTPCCRAAFRERSSRGGDAEFPLASAASDNEQVWRRAQLARHKMSLSRLLLLGVRRMLDRHLRGILPLAPPAPSGTRQGMPDSESSRFCSDQCLWLGQHCSSQWM